MAQNGSPRDGASLLGQIYRGRKIKAFMLGAGATFALLALFWALSVRGFVAHTTVRLAVTDPAISLTDVDAQVRELWKVQTGDSGLKANVQQVSSVIQVQNPSMMGRNFEKLRTQLGYRIDRDPLSRYVDIQLALTGSNDRGDTILVQNIADNIASGFSSKASVSGGAVSSEDLLAFRQSQLEKLERAQWLLAQIEQDLEGVRVALNGNQNGSFSGAADSQRASNQAAGDLERQLHALLNEKDALSFDGVSTFDPDMMDLQVRIDRTRSDLASVNSADQFAPLVDQPRTDPNTSQSPFIMASHRNGPTPTVDTEGISRSLESIDVESLKSTISEIQNSLASTGAVDGTNPPYYVKAVRKAQLVPARGLPSALNVLTLIALSGLVGSVIAWRYEPLKEDQGFASVGDIADKLNLPVLSMLTRKTEERAFEPEMTPVANLLLQLARFFLLTFTVTVAVAMIVSPTVRAAFWENPFNGLARIVWFLTGR